MREAEEYLARARSQAAEALEQLEADIATRKEVLVREVAVLERQRAGVLAQLDAMRALAEQAGREFPTLSEDQPTVTGSDEA